MGGAQTYFPSLGAHDRDALCPHYCMHLRRNHWRYAHPNIEGLLVGHMTEKVSTYADDTLLYLDGSTEVLPTALALRERFGSFSGLRINWYKSQMLPLDSFPVTQDQAILPLQRVD